VFNILLSGSIIGTITFAASSHTGVLASSILNTFHIGDNMTITAPSPADGTGAGLAVTFDATRT